jgi:hypothetical protein
MASSLLNALRRRVASTVNFVESPGRGSRRALRRFRRVHAPLALHGARCSPGCHGRAPNGRGDSGSPSGYSKGIPQVTRRSCAGNPENQPNRDRFLCRNPSCTKTPFTERYFVQSLRWKILVPATLLGHSIYREAVLPQGATRCQKIDLSPQIKAEPSTSGNLAARIQ